MRKYKKTLFMAVCAALFGFAGCGGGGGSGTATGILSMSLTDAPPADEANVTGVYITISGIEAHIAGLGWQNLAEFNASVNPINLLAWQNGNAIALGDAVLTAGQYTQLRFMLDAPEVGGAPGPNPGCYITFDDNSSEPLFVPSGSQTGFKVTGNYSVPVNGTIALTADFDVRKSVVYSGGVYKLKPTIRVVATDETGSIGGTVSNTDANSSYTIYAYAYGDADVPTWDIDEPNEVDGVRFADGLSSTAVAEDGSYTLAFLSAGRYDLVIAKYDANGVYVTYYLETGITVESAATTPFDWVL